MLRATTMKKPTRGPQNELCVFVFQISDNCLTSEAFLSVTRHSSEVGELIALRDITDEEIARTRARDAVGDGAIVILWCHAALFEIQTLYTCIYVKITVKFISSSHES